MPEFVFRSLQDLKRPSRKLKKQAEPQTTFIPRELEAQTPIDDTAKTAETPIEATQEGFGGFDSTEVETLALKNLSNAARVCLSYYRKEQGKQDAGIWLERFSKAHAACLLTFSEDRRHVALKDYGRRYCHGQAAKVIAAHTIALRLWTIHRQNRTGTAYGTCLEAACKACGLDVSILPEKEVRP